jgi:ferredoxin
LAVSDSGARLRVDPTRCDGAGYCAEIVPEVVSLDDWGYPILSEHPLEDPALLRLAERAVAQCPRLALALTSGTDRSR